MRIALGPVGAPADVFPMFALGKVLQGRGHHVILCAPEEYRSRAYHLGFQMVSCGSSYQEYLEGHERLDDASAELVRRLNQDMAMHFVSLRDALREADVLIGSMLQIAGPSIAEQFGVLYFYSITSPFLLDPEQYPYLALPYEKASGLFASRNRGKRIKEWDELVLKALNRERGFSGLPPVEDLYRYLFHSGPVLVAVDPEMGPFTEDANQTVTGFWLYDQPGDWQPEIEEYINTGSSLIYIDHIKLAGSKSLESLCRSIAAAGFRVVLSSRWKHLSQSELPAECRILDSASYSKFFPRLKAVVHDGNSELVAQAARFGIPQVIIPNMMMDYDWAERIHKMGLGPAPLLKPEVQKAAEVIRQTASNPGIQERAHVMSQKIQSRDGLTTAAQAIDKL